MVHRIVIPSGRPHGFVAKEPGGGFSLIRLLKGARLDDDELPSVCRFTVRPDPRRPLELADYYPHMHLMSRRLVAALESAGVANLQKWTAELRILGSDQLVADYLVVNIVGRVACAAAAESESTPLAEGRYFLRLVVDAARVAGLRMFRLAESPIDVLVDDSIAQVIRTGGFSHVELEALQERA